MNLRWAMRLLRTIKRRGICGEYQFYRYEPDEYGEAGERMEGVCAEGYFSELLHRDSPYVSWDTNEAGTTDTRCTPMMILPYEDNPGILRGDLTEIDRTVYEVLHVRRVAGVYCLVSLRRAAA